MIWPIVVAVTSDVFYQVSAKSLPAKVTTFASLTITYLVGAAVSMVLFYVLSGKHDIVAEWKYINWTTFVLGLAIVGLEAGSIYMYKAGWNINTGYLVKSMVLAIALIVVGYFLYKEQFTTTKALGVVMCIGGLYFIHK